MRLYRIREEATSRTLDWAGTQADARALVKTYGPNATWVEEDVPTDKPGLLAWLKANATEEGDGHGSPGEPTAASQ